MRLKLQEILSDRGISQKDFSELSGITQPNVSLYCSGKSLPTIATVMKICDILSVSPSELLGYDETTNGGSSGSR